MNYETHRKKVIGSAGCLVTLMVALIACNNPSHNRRGKTIAHINGDNSSGEKVKKDENNGDATDERERADSPVLVSGSYLADYNNSRIRCDYKEKQKELYKTSCVVVVALANGREVKADKVKDGVELSWQLPTTIRGIASSENCEAHDNDLVYLCEVKTTNSLNIAEVQYTLNVKDEKNPERAELSTLVFPFSVRIAAGIVPNIPFSYQGQAKIETGIRLDTPVSPANDMIGFQQNDFRAEDISLAHPGGICMVDKRFFFIHGNSVYEVKEGVLSLYAGSSNAGNVENFTHRLRTYMEPWYISCTSSGVYVTSTSLARIYKLTDDGAISLIAGRTYEYVVTADGHAAKEAALFQPHGLAVTSTGEIIFAEAGAYRIRKINSQGLLETIAGSGVEGNSGDGGPATKATFTLPRSVVLGKDGAIYVADSRAHVVRKITSDGKIMRVAGVGAPRYESPDAKNALSEPVALALGDNDTLYIGEYYRGVKRLTGGGALTQFLSAGADLMVNVMDLAVSERGKMVKNRPTYSAIAIAPDGSFYSDSWSGIDRYAKTTLVRTAFVGEKEVSGVQTSSILADKARFFEASAIAYSASGQLIIVDWKTLSTDELIFSRISEENGRFYRNALFDHKSDPLLMGSNETLTLSLAGISKNSIGGIATDKSGAIYFANLQLNKIIKISSTGVTTTVAGGGGSATSSGDGGKATAATLLRPLAIAIADDGTIYFVETGRLRKITQGIISTVAGNGETQIVAEDEPLAANASIDPQGIALSRDGRLFIADYANNKIKMIDNAGKIHTIAGGGNERSHKEGVDAKKVRLSYPQSIAATNDGTIYFVNLGTDEVKELQQNENGGWLISNFFGKQNEGDCATGHLAGVTSTNKIDDSIRNSLSVICIGNPRTVTITDSCPSVGGKTKIAISQGFVEYVNIVEVERPCRL